MKIYLDNGKIACLEIVPDELRMVLETFGVLPSNIPIQQEIPFTEHTTEQPPAVPQRPSLQDRLKELYQAFPEGRVHRKVLETLAQTTGEMTSKQLREILHYEKNHQVAAVMAPLSRKAKKLKLRYEDIIASDKIVTPEGPVQRYWLTKPMREAMKDLGFASDPQGISPAGENHQRQNIAALYLSKRE